ncbi:MAG: 3'-5' exonuclease [Lachnospiraceae bacterium]|nr:3'-5' exonuclease [Lachnospiraceae bacterium]
MRQIFVDLEMNALDERYTYEKNITPYEIIEIGAVMLGRRNKVEDTFKIYVKPQYNDKIGTWYTKITGITTEMVQDADPFEVAFQKFYEWCESCGERYRIWAWSKNDYHQMLFEILLKRLELSEGQKRMMTHWDDFQEWYMHLLREKRPVALSRALGYAKLPFEGSEHDALDDAFNTAMLYVHTRSENNRRQIVELYNREREKKLREAERQTNKPAE